MIRKTPPYSKETEQAVIACMLLDENSVAKVAAELPAEAFYIPAHQMIVSAIFKQFSERKPCDVVSVISSISDEVLEKVGGADYIASMVDIIPSAAALAHYVGKLRELWQYRQMITIGFEAQEKAFEQTEDVSTLAAEFARKVTDISKGKGTVYDVGMLSDELYQRYEKFTSKSLVGHSCGIHKLDTIFGGIQPGLYVVAGRPHMGKSSFSIRLGGGLGFNGLPGLICQFDGSVQGYVEKMLCQVGGFTRFDLTFGKVGMDAFTGAMGKLDACNLQFVGERLDAFGIRAKVQAMRDNIGFLVVDQLNTMPAINPKDDEVKRLSRNIQELKAIAVDYKIPVIVAAQINRGAESRSDKRPYVSDLKGSGAIEEEADVIFLLYRDEYYNADSKDAGLLEVDIAKNKITEICPTPLKLTKAEAWDIFPKGA